MVPIEPIRNGRALSKYFFSWLYETRLIPYVKLPVKESMKNRMASPR